MVLRIRWGALGITLWAAGCGAGPDQDTVASSALHRPNPPPPVSARPCRDDLFFFDRPLWEDPFPSTFTSNLESVVNGILQPSWFCADNTCLASLAGLHVQVLPVLPHRASSWRSDGDRRFYRLQFVDGTGLRRAVLHEQICTVLNDLRTQVAGLASGTVRMGRECDASSMSLAPYATAAGQTWQWTRLGVPAAAPGISPVSQVRVALIDSEIPAGIATTLAISDGGQFTSGGIATNNDANPHFHGSAMATFIRHLAPEVDLRSYRVIDQQGVATGGSIAQAIDAAIYDGTSPLILNLSFGFPPELTHTALVQSVNPITLNVCTAVEDAFGEPIRYVLDVARHLDAQGTRAISSFSSAGNRAGHINDPQVFFSSSVPPSPCQPADGAPLVLPFNFFPAGYNDLSSCRRAHLSYTTPWAITTAVGAVDDRDRPSGLALADVEPALVAPGQNVFAVNPALPGDEHGVQCNTNFGLDEFFEFPSELSGSSVSAALASGAAAHAQASIAGKHQPALSSDTLARLLYLTGDPTCRARSDGTPIRRLDVARLDQAIACETLLKCAQNGDPNHPIGPTTLSGCASALSKCGLVDACTSYSPVQFWPSSLVQQIECPNGGSSCIPTDPGCVDICGNGACPPGVPSNETALDRFSAGSIGSQPGSTACPDCPGRVANLTIGTLDLTAGLSAGFDPNGVTFTGPRLVVYDDAKNEIASLDLLIYSSEGQWIPGHTVVVKNANLKDPCHGNPACKGAVQNVMAGDSGSVFLNLVVTSLDGRQSLDQSIITLQQ